MQMGNKHIVFTFFNNHSKEKLKQGIPISVLLDIVSELNISELGTEARIGDKNALRVTMLMGSAKIAYCSMLSFLKSKRSIKSREIFVPYYNEEVFIVDLNGILKISLADIISISISVMLKMRHKRGDQLSVAQKEIS